MDFINNLLNSKDVEPYVQYRTLEECLLPILDKLNEICLINVYNKNNKIFTDQGVFKYFIDRMYNFLKDDNKLLFTKKNKNLESTITLSSTMIDYKEKKIDLTTTETQDILKHLLFDKYEIILPVVLKNLPAESINEEFKKYDNVQFEYSTNYNVSHGTITKKSGILKNYYDLQQTKKIKITNNEEIELKYNIKNYLEKNYAISVSCSRNAVKENFNSDNLTVLVNKIWKVCEKNNLN